MAEEIDKKAPPPVDDEVGHVSLREEQRDAAIAVPIEEEAVQDAYHVRLSWRVMAQVFVVVAAGSVIAFIARDLGDAPLAGWVIQGPLLMQSVLSPIVGRLSDVTDRKLLAVAPPLVATAGAVMSATARSMAVLIGGGVLIGATLSTISILHAITPEILPLKYRTLASGFNFMGGAVGGLIGSLGAGAVTNTSSGGWRYIFWIQAIFHALTAIGIFCFYWPPKRRTTAGYASMSLGQYVWACDPVGCVLFIGSATLVLLSLDWAGGAYAWGDPHVAAPLALGLALLVLFALYEWKGRSDGLVAHVFFHRNANFAYSVFAFAVEGWIFYSAVNSVVPQIVLNLGFETDAWSIAVRQLSYQLPVLAVSVPVTWYATRYKDPKTPLLVTFTVFLAVCISYAALQPSWDVAQIVLNVLSGIGQSGPLTLLVACVQFTAPHAFLSTATGLAFSARAIGGAFGSAVLNAIINGRLSAHLAPAVGAAAVSAGLPEAAVPALLEALEAGTLFETGGGSVPGALTLTLTPEVLAAAAEASRDEYAHAYRLAWASVIPFVVLAVAAVALLKGVRDLMTEKVEATVERVSEKKTTAEV
ncbi:hypothetical protein SLS62_008328 [Diatrype stigma]|uniref:Major facilitator superfamily (MFS) profile domain-containing protein n=1 Tax=Diatrype stigma TaxID=117547 RepID=A0AAN9UTF3_9PEZI